MAIDVVQASSSATVRGTRIVKQGSEMDKNAFLRILSVELSNQDPESAKDSTQYVSQMAQFAQLEQTANLNNTLSMSGASSLIGLNVKLNSYDVMKNQYEGTVLGVIKNGSDIKLKVEVMDNGKRAIKEFNYRDVTEVNYQGAVESADDNI